MDKEDMILEKLDMIFTQLQILSKQVTVAEAHKLGMYPDDLYEELIRFQIKMAQEMNKE